MNRIKLEDKIKTILLSNKITPTPENFVNAGLEALNELIKLKNTNDIQFVMLLEIIQKAKFFKLTAFSLKILNLIIKSHTSNVCNILKNYYSDQNALINPTMFSENSLDFQLFQLLVNHCSSICICNLIAKHYDILNYFNLCSEEQKRNLLINNMNIFGLHLNLLKYLQSCENSQNQVILSYLQFKNDSNSILDSDLICSIIPFITSETQWNFQIISLILEFNRRNISKAKMINKNGNVSCFVSNIFTNQLIDLIRYETLDSDNSELALVELYSLVSDSLLPNFISIIKDINSMFIAENKLPKLLRNLVSYIKIEEFAEIVGEIDISKHHVVFKGISNVDLSVFIEIYKVARKGTEFESLPIDLTNSACFSCSASSPGNDALDCAISCLPCFSYYSTDYFFNISSIILIFKAHFHTHKNIICSAIERMIQSHTANLMNRIIMNNQVSMDDSKNILSALKSSGLIYDLLNSFTESNNADTQQALELMIQLTGLDLSRETATFLLDSSSNDLKICSALRLMPFFIKGKKFNFDFISRILELASSNQIDIQKKSYLLLSQIYENSSTDVCICDLLYTTMQQSSMTPALKNRFMLQRAIMKVGCANCKLEDKNEIYSKFVTDLIKNLKTGNSKCKKFISELVVEYANDNLNNFILLLTSFLSKKNVDLTCICGAVECLIIILEHITFNQQYIGQNGKYNNDELLVQIFSAIVEISLYSQDIVKPMLRILPFFNSEHYNSKIASIIDSYINQFSKKYNKELKVFCISAEKNGFPLTKPMKTLLKFRNKSGRSKEIGIVNRTDFNKLF